MGSFKYLWGKTVISESVKEIAEQIKMQENVTDFWETYSENGKCQKWEQYAHLIATTCSY